MLLFYVIKLHKDKLQIYFNNFLGLEMVLENNEDLVTEEITKMKRKLKDITKILDSQGQLLKLIVQVMMEL